MNPILHISRDNIYANKVYVIFCIIFLIIFLNCSTNATRKNPVPQELIEQLTIALLTFDNKFLMYQSYETLKVLQEENAINSDEIKGSPKLSWPVEKVNILMKLLKDNYSYDVTYKDDKATVEVDISKTGIIEWLNVEFMHRDSNYRFEENKIIKLYLIEHDNKWYCFHVGYYLDPSPEGWPEKIK